VLLVAAVVLVLIGAGAALRGSRREGAITYVITSDHEEAHEGYVAVRPDAGPKALRFSDGSEVEFGTGSAGRIESRSAHGAVVSVERGRVSFAVEHHADTRWSVRAGPFDVAVTGTAFDVQWTPDTDTFVLRLTAGSVVVRGPSADAIALRPGQQIVARVRESDARVGPIGDPDPASPAPVGSGVPEEPAPSASAPATGRTHATAPSETARGLLARAESLRLAGRHEDAAATLERLVRTFPDDPRAGLAAYQLGRIRLGSLHDPRRALEAFGFVLEHEPDAPFGEDAEAGRLEAADQLGDIEKCKRWRDAFLVARPTSTHTRQIGKLCLAP